MLHDDDDADAVRPGPVQERRKAWPITELAGSADALVAVLIGDGLKPRPQPATSAAVPTPQIGVALGQRPPAFAVSSARRPPCSHRSAASVWNI
jgi:hypothetical protein